MNKKITISKTNIVLLLFIFIVGLAMIVVSIILLDQAFKLEFIQLFPFLLGSFFLILGVIAIVYVLFDNNFDFHEDKIVVKSILNAFKYIIYYSDIQSYFIDKTYHNNRSTEEIIIQTKLKRITIPSNVTNYSSVKSILSKHLEYKAPDLNKRKLKAAKISGKILIVIGIIIVLKIALSINKEFEPIKKNQLTSFSAHISESPKISKSSNGKSNTRRSWIDISIEEFPTFYFTIEGRYFSAAAEEKIIDHINIGDQVEIQILTDIYEKKISKSKMPNFWEKSINYKSILIYGFKFNGKQYISFEKMNAIDEDNFENPLIWYYLIFHLSMIALGIYFLRLKIEDY